jgi:hypothetical protein
LGLAEWRDHEHQRDEQCSDRRRQGPANRIGDQNAMHRGSFGWVLVGRRRLCPAQAHTYTPVRYAGTVLDSRHNALLWWSCG